MGYLLSYAMIDHFLSGNRSGQIVAAVYFCYYLQPSVAAIKTGTSFCCVD